MRLPDRADRASGLALVRELRLSRCQADARQVAAKGAPVSASAELTPERRAEIVAQQRRDNQAAIAKGAAERRERERLAPPPAPFDWRSALKQRGDRYLGDERNVIAALRLSPELSGLVRFNAFAMVVEFTRAAPWRDVAAATPWTDDDDVALQAWLQERDIDARVRSTVADSVVMVAKDQTCDPVADYLEALEWDGTERLNRWLRFYLGADQREDYLSAVGRCFCISAVARALEPGCQADHLIVLEGPQGIGKSRSARILARRRQWFAGDLPDLHSKDAPLQLAGKWIVELGELAAVRRAELERVKAFITQPVDVYRPPYGRRTVSVPRHSVFIATTNEAEYLRDKTGNRRFWPVRCGRIDLEALERDVDQLWAEAVHAYQHREAWHLTGDALAAAEREQSERVLVTELEARVADYLERLAGNGNHETTVRDVLIYGLALDPDAGDFTERAARLGAQVSDAMRTSGWEFIKRQGRGPNRRRVYRLQKRV
ncbi:MAG: virulence-associated E family protein [Steroidobacteraceae bacterium]